MPDADRVEGHQDLLVCLCLAPEPDIKLQEILELKLRSLFNPYPGDPLNRLAPLDVIQTIKNELGPGHPALEI